MSNCADDQRNAHPRGSDAASPQGNAQQREADEQAQEEAEEPEPGRRAAFLRFEQLRHDADVEIVLRGQEAMLVSIGQERETSEESPDTAERTPPR